MAYAIDALYGGDIRFSNSPPKLVLICGPCRVGTTALSVVFAKAGIESHMQPIKSARRAKELGEQVKPWNIGQKRGEMAVVKETFGPHAATEFFDPVEILLSMGYPKEKIMLIPILRDPSQVFCSWREKWGDAKLGKLEKAFDLTLKVKEDAEKEGVFVLPYVHEAIKENQPTAVVAMLFERLGLTIRQLSLTLSSKWEDLGDIENVFLYDEPPERFIADIGKRGRYQYKDRFVPEADGRLIQSRPKFGQVYGAFYEECETWLEFKAAG